MRIPVRCSSRPFGRRGRQSTPSVNGESAYGKALNSISQLASHALWLWHETNREQIQPSLRSSPSTRIGDKASRTALRIRTTHLIYRFDMNATFDLVRPCQVPLQGLLRPVEEGSIRRPSI